MIRGIGVDIVQISRMQRSLEIPNFIESVFTKNEILNCHGDRNEYFATRFAGKEAVFKALNTTIDMRKIEILNRNDGAPYVVGVSNVYISITTESDLAIAFCVIEH